MSTGLWRRHSTVFWITASFLVAATLAAIVFGAVDVHDRVGVALRVTARWSFLLFWLAYTGSAMADLGGGRRSTGWRVTAVNLALPLRRRSWCMLDLSCCPGRVPGWRSSGPGSCLPICLCSFRCRELSAELSALRPHARCRGWSARCRVYSSEPLPGLRPRARRTPSSAGLIRAPDRRRRQSVEGRIDAAPGHHFEMTSRRAAFLSATAFYFCLAESEISELVRFSRRSRSSAIRAYRSASLRCTSFIISRGPVFANSAYFVASFR
jgi:hypothetical protein